MKWYDKKISKEMLSDAREFCKSFGVSIKFSKDLSCANVIAKKLFIVVATEDSTIRVFWSTVLHELCHIFCHKQHIFPMFHRRSTIVNLAKLRQQAYRAETYVDRYAKELMKVYLPDIPYAAGYVREDDKQYLIDLYSPKQ